MKSLFRSHGHDDFIRRALWRVLSVILVACLAYAVLSGQPASAEPGVSIDASVSPDQPEPVLWAEIYDAIRRLADAGSIPASRLALQMYQYGKSVYGMSFDATARQLQCWEWQVECGRCYPCVDYG